MIRLAHLQHFFNQLYWTTSFTVTERFS